MERLKGKNILIGKEPGAGRLVIAIEGGKVAAVGSPGSVPASVSRCKAAEGKAHARLSIDNLGEIRVTNLKPENFTFVNGAEIVTKRVAQDSVIELGTDRFKVPVSLILKSARNLVDPDSAGGTSQPTAGTGPTAAVNSGAKMEKKVETFNISHLEGVWKSYKESLRRMQEKQKKINLIRSGCGIFTMCAMPCIFFIGEWGYALTAIGVIGNIYSFVGMKNDNTAEDREYYMEWLQDNYVCPNPACNKFLGNLSYKLLKKQHSMHCPYCKCNFTEK